MTDHPDIHSIQEAASNLAGQVFETPLVPSTALSALAGAPVYLKLEHLQVTGSFKVRGAINAISQLDGNSHRRGVVTVSTGNHGRALAHAAKLAGVPCLVCMSNLAPQNKIDGIKALGAEVRIVGDSQDEAQHEVVRLVREEGYTELPPFDHTHIIAGQGTLGLEIVRALPKVSTLLVPVSGGGLISGVALAAQAHNPDIRVVGVSMERGAAMAASLEAGKPVEVKEHESLADSLGGGIGLDNAHTFAIVRERVERILLVSEAEIAAGMRHAYWEEKLVVEGGGVVGISALLMNALRKQGPLGTTVVVLSGCNLDMNQHLRIVSDELD